MSPVGKIRFVAKKPVPEDSLLKGLVKWNSKIACIGGFGSPKDDPTPAFLAQLTRSKSVTLVDCKDKELFLRLQKVRPKGKFPLQLREKIVSLSQGNKLDTGAGGLISYRRGVGQIIYKRDLRSVMRTKKGIRLQPGLAWKTGVKPGTLDVVVDRDTSYWISKQDPSKAEKAVNHYLSLVKKGGKIVLLFDQRFLKDKTLPITKTIKKMISEKRATGEYFPVETNQFHVEGMKIEPRRPMARAIILTKL